MLLAFTNHAGWIGVYLAVVGILLASGFGLPVPEDIPLLVGGMLCGLGHANIYIMTPLAFMAVLSADLTVFLLGRKYGHYVPRLPIIRRYLTTQRLAWAEQKFIRHGGKTLFVARFLPGVRSAIYFSAGTFKTPTWKILAFDGAAALLSVPVLLLLGYFGAKHFDKVSRFVEQTQIGLMLAIVAAVALLVVWRIRRRRALAATGQA